MPVFDSSGVTIHYTDDGEGPVIVLVAHGFASSIDGNWKNTGVIDALVKDGRRVVAIDCRGHGESDRPHDPAAYGGTAMADDVIALMDHLGIAEADMMGYSMGGGITASLLVRHPERIRTAILAGVGDATLEGGRSRERAEAIARALEAEDPKAGETPTARGFRQFADRSGNDRKALAAIQRSERGGYDASRLRDVSIPVMVLVGESDDLVGSADRLAATIPGARYVKVPGDHLTAVNREYRAAVLDFLHDVSPAQESP